MRTPNMLLAAILSIFYAAAQVKPGVASLPPAEAVPIPDPAL